MQREEARLRRFEEWKAKHSLQGLASGKRDGKAVHVSKSPRSIEPGTKFGQVIGDAGHNQPMLTDRKTSKFDQEDALESGS